MLMIWVKDKEGLRMGNFGFGTIRFNNPSKNTKIRILKNRNRERSVRYFQKNPRKSIDLLSLQLKKSKNKDQNLRKWAPFGKNLAPGFLQKPKPIPIHYFLNVHRGIAPLLEKGGYFL